MKNTFFRVHSGCSVSKDEVVAIWSEKYSDPKLDDQCYLTKVFLRGNSTPLTIASFSSKEEADRLIEEFLN